MWYRCDMKTGEISEISDPMLIARHEERRVAEDTVNGDWISTVFLGCDHGFGAPGGPVLFETMIFPSKDDLQEKYCQRYRTLEGARMGHLFLVVAMERGMSLDEVRLRVEALEEE
jgi:hypothetical protein